MLVIIMKKLMIKDFLWAMVILITLFFLSIPAFGTEIKDATDLTGSMLISLPDGINTEHMTDNDINTFVSLPGSSVVTVSYPEGISGIYIEWNKIPGNWSYSIDGVYLTAGTDGYLHEYVAFSKTALTVAITIPDSGAQITDIYCFSEGTLPDWVQVWDPPCERADLMLLSTHSDDEQLFFAGVLPYYAGELETAVQVVYMTNHWDTVSRPHEQLNGLWTVGVRNYPVIGPFPDDAASLGNTKESVDTVLQRALSVYDEESLTAFQVEMIRRFRPQVIIGHDIAGEYRHGAHIVNTYTLMKALEISYDKLHYPDSAETYGVWNVPKTYLHLYEENPIVMDWDIPLKSFGDITAFEVSKLGYACHTSQQWTWFTRWISKAKASEITSYNPCYYGLYRSTVGADVDKNDFLENITTYHEQAEIEKAEQAALAEAERVASEKAAEDAAAFAQSERLAAANAMQAAAEAEKGASDSESPQPGALIATLCVAISVILAVIAAIALLLRCKKRRERTKS